MTTGIYKITNLVNNKVYIGQSVHIETRWKEHCRDSAHSLIGKAIRKYGKENFSFQILEECTEQELTAKESAYIQQYESLVPKGYNIALIDNGKNLVFNNYSLDTFKEIVKDIKDTQLSFRSIAEKYGLDVSMIYYLNRGDYHTLSQEVYPLRPVKDLQKKIWRCVDCGVEIAKGSTRCVSCARKHQQVCERPSREELKKLIRTMPFTKIGERFGVADNTIRKWCKAQNLPSKSKDIKSYSDQEWEQM